MNQEVKTPTQIIDKSVLRIKEGLNTLLETPDHEIGIESVAKFVETTEKAVALATLEGAQAILVMFAKSDVMNEANIEKCKAIVAENQIKIESYE